MGTSAQALPPVDKLIMRNDPKLNQLQITMLCNPVTEEEITEAVASIGDDKVPGIDGYNAFFYKKVWHIVKKEISDVVIDFFISRKMYAPINCNDYFGS